jgi:hypothetical protein
VNYTYVVCIFVARPKGRLVCYTPSDRKGTVYIDRQSTHEVRPGVSYMCKVLRTLVTGVRFVLVDRTAGQILTELSEHLTHAIWKRGSRITDVITATFESEAYGKVKAEWYETTGDYQTRALHLDFYRGVSKIKLAFTHRNPDVDLDHIAERVHACTGATEDLVALIGRRAPWHRHKGML